ncbi:MAG: MFS transporter [Promethearchaeota archaeon]
MSNLEYKKSYTKIFLFFYFLQGMVVGVPSLILVPYIAQVLGGEFDFAQYLIIATIATLPWVIKLIVGVLSDKYGSKKYGRRFPYIFGFGTFGGIAFCIMGLNLPSDESIYTYLAIYLFIIMVGIAFADSALDGLILDVTPKENLGKIQGFTWAMRLIGIIVGGAVLGMIFMILKMIPILFIIIGILMILACFLPYFVEELPVEKVKKMGHDILSIFTRRKNYKVMLFVLTGAITGRLMLNFLIFLILISMGVLDVNETVVSITSGSAVDLLGWYSVFFFISGGGTIIGSIIAGKFADRNRKKSITIAYLVYIPFVLITLIPFVLTSDYLASMILGFICIGTFGLIEAARSVSGSTIRGDLVKKEYPNLKGTYYALLVSCVNGGIALGSLLGAILIIFFSLYFTSFYILYLIIVIFCAVFLTIAYLLFRLIDPADYELKHVLGEEKEVYFG